MSVEDSYEMMVVSAILVRLSFLGLFVGFGLGYSGIRQTYRSLRGIPRVGPLASSTPSRMKSGTIMDPMAEVVCDENGCEVQGGMMPDSFKDEDLFLRQYATVLTIVPILAPFIAFLGYDYAVALYHNVITFGQSWYAVDGGELEAALLIPVVNGIVLPSISIVLGTLVSSTLSVLRNRQVIIRECLNREVADLTTLASAIDAIFGRYVEDVDTRGRMLLLLRQYIERLILESRSTATQSSIKSLEMARTSKNEMDLIQLELINTGCGHRKLGDPREGFFDDPFRWSIPNLIVGLNAQRSARLATLLTGYPVQHWLIIGLLYASVVLCFLEESDGAALQFLGGVQLRGLFTILIGASAAISSLFVDLNDPFRGNFCIKQTTDQLVGLLGTIDDAILAGASRQWVSGSLIDTKFSEQQTMNTGKVSVPVGEWLAIDRDSSIPETEPTRR